MLNLFLIQRSIQFAEAYCALSSGTAGSEDTDMDLDMPREYLGGEDNGRKRGPGTGENDNRNFFPFLE